MHILYVDMQYDYGDKERGPNVIGAKGFKGVFERLGHKVSTFYYDDYLARVDQLQKDLLDFARQTKPDLIYFSLYTDQFHIETLKELKKMAITVGWFGDDQWRFDSFTKKYAPYFTWNVTTDPFSVSKYKANNIQNVFLSQWAAVEEDLVGKKQQGYKYDVTFVGGGHSYRKWFIDELKKRGVKVEAFGFGWPNGKITQDQMIQVFQTSKINLNLSNSVSFDLRYLKHNLRNPISVLRSSKTASQVKARNFEIPYYGGFQLAEYVPGLDLYFNIGKEVACFKDIDEAELLIHHYLENDQEREKLKKSSIEKARNNHTFFHRHKEFLDSLK